MKEEDENKLFDSQFRSILGDAREDVPGQVWLDIEQRLSMMEKAESGASEKTRPGNKTATVPFWTRIAGSVAAAAAIAAALFLSGTFDGQVSDMQYDRIAEADGINIVGHSGMHHVKVADVPAPEILKDISRTEAAVIRDNAGNMAETYPETESEAALPVSETEAAVETDGIAQDTDGIAPAAEIQPAKDDAAEENPADEDFGNWDSLFAEEKTEHKIKTSLTLSGNAISNTNSSVSYDRAPISYTSGKNQLTQDKVSESSESSYSVPVSFGAGVKVDFSKRWAASIGVNYSLLRRTFDGAFFDVHDDGTYTKTDFTNIDNRQDYIGIPVNVYYSILRSNIIDFYAYAGGTAEKCVSNAYRMSADGSDINHRESVKGMQFSANVGLGMEFIIADLVGIYIDPSLRYYFPDERQPRSIRTAQPLMFGLELGFRFHL